MSVSLLSARRRDESGRGVLAVIAVGLLLGTVATVLVVLYRSGVGPFPNARLCQAEVGNKSVTLDLEQGRYAALITGVAVGRGLPARAATIALATAYQESKIRNIDYGDRDSLGLFQQRPSQGWGSDDQVMDPYYATNAFYDALVEIDGYRDLRVTEAAQRVQRSAFGEAYADHEEDARVLASALSGYDEAAFTCRIRAATDLEEQERGPDGLTPRAEDVRGALTQTFGDDLSLGGFAPEGVDSGHSEDSTHYQGRAVDVFVRPVSEENQRFGWAVAHWAVANAAELEIATVIFDDRIWTARRSDEGWRDYEPGEGPGDPEVRRHLDHVHIDVF